MAEEQRTLDWFRDRLGKFTGSRIGDLMRSGRKKDAIFGETALSYIYQIAAERDMNKKIINDDFLFEEYLNFANPSSKAMDWGTEQEMYARELYEKIKGVHVEEVGCIPHPTIRNFASSPDGRVVVSKMERGSVEIKCPSQAVFMRYVDLVVDGESLKKVNPDYYYQCQSHMMCDNTDWCDFIVYNPFQANPIHIVRIEPDRETIVEMEKRIADADKLADFAVLNFLIKTS